MFRSDDDGTWSQATPLPTLPTTGGPMRERTVPSLLMVIPRQRQRQHVRRVAPPGHFRLSYLTVEGSGGLLRLAARILRKLI